MGSKRALLAFAIVAFSASALSGCSRYFLRQYTLVSEPGNPVGNKGATYEIRPLSFERLRFEGQPDPHAPESEGNKKSAIEFYGTTLAQRVTQSADAPWAIVSKVVDVESDKEARWFDANGDRASVAVEVSVVDRTGKLVSRFICRVGPSDDYAGAARGAAICVGNFLKNGRVL